MCASWASYARAVSAPCPPAILCPHQPSYKLFIVKYLWLYQKLFYIVTIPHRVEIHLLTEDTFSFGPLMAPASPPPGQGGHVKNNNLWICSRRKLQYDQHKSCTWFPVPSQNVSLKHQSGYEVKAGPPQMSEQIIHLADNQSIIRIVCQLSTRSGNQNVKQSTPI